MSSNDENWNAIGKKQVLQRSNIWLDIFEKTLQSHILPFLNPDTPLFGNTFITFRKKSLSCKGV